MARTFDVRGVGLVHRIVLAGKSMSHRTVPARYQSPQATSKGFRFNSANSPLLSSRRIVRSLRYAINTKKRNTEFLREHFPWNFAPLISFADRKVIPWTSIRIRVESKVGKIIGERKEGKRGTTTTRTNVSFGRLTWPEMGNGARGQRRAVKCK